MLRFQDAARDAASDARATGDDTAHVQDFAAELRAEVVLVLDDLQHKGLIDDRRAADALLHAKAPRCGQRRLRQLLQQRALDADLIDATLQRARETEVDRAREVWRRRFGTPAVDWRERARQQRFLAGRGFDAATIERVLRESERPDPG